MIKKILTSSVSMALLAGCVHTTPLPVQVSQPGDAIMSCQSIVSEMESMKNTVREKDSDLNGQIAKNSLLGVAGAFVLVPWFFIDTSDANTVEGQAAKARYNKLQQLYSDKNCATGGKPPEAATTNNSVNPAGVTAPVRPKKHKKIKAPENEAVQKKDSNGYNLI